MNNYDQIKSAGVVIQLARRAWKEGRLKGHPTVTRHRAYKTVVAVIGLLTDDQRESYEADLRSLVISPLEAALDFMQSLPVTKSQWVTHPLYFALILGKWEPAYNAEINEETGMASLGLRDSDSSTVAWAASFGFWAHVDADGNPSLFPEFYEQDYVGVDHVANQTDDAKQAGDGGRAANAGPAGGGQAGS